MRNKDISKILFEIGEYLAMDDIPFKPQAYKKAALGINSLEEELADIYKGGGLNKLKDIPGIGEAIALKIEEAIKTGGVKLHKRLKKALPVDLYDLSGIEGVGPKRIRALYQKLGVKTVGDLKKVAKRGEVRGLDGFGEKSEEKILESIEYFENQKGRIPYVEAKEIADKFEKRVREHLKISQSIIAGSLRRKKETIGDLDILVVSKDPEEVMDFFVSQKEIGRIIAKGPTKSSVSLKQGVDVDLRVVEEESYGAALLYFTGSKSHNIWMRKIAQDKGLKLNEYGLFDGDKKIAGETEEEIYEKLGLEYIPPEKRENAGDWVTEKK